MKRLFLWFNVLCIFSGYTTSSWADDVWFISPQSGMSVSGEMTIQIQAPLVQTPVRVWIEQEPRDRMVWSGQLTPQNDYTIKVDTSRFSSGKYEVKAEYYLNGKEFDGDVTFWVGSSKGQPGPEGGTYY